MVVVLVIVVAGASVVAGGSVVVDGGSDGVGSLVEGMVSAPPGGSLVGGTSEPGTVPAEPSPCRVNSTTSLELSGRPSASSATTW